MQPTTHLHAGKTLLFVPCIITMLLLTSCARKMNFGVSSIVPAATGSVKIKKDKNNNYAIDVNVTNLADPGRLTPPKNVYIVWMETKNNGLKKIGLLKSSGGLLTQTLKGSLETVTTFEPVSFFITGETDATTQYPGTPIVLHTSPETD